MTVALGGIVFYKPALPQVFASFFATFFFQKEKSESHALA